jgi:uncharacterized membrane protein
MPKQIVKRGLERVAQFMSADRREDALLKQLRMKHPAHKKPAELDKPSIGDRVADAVASTVGSWTFIIIQSGMLVAWIIGNSLAGDKAWDPFPFILLNLMLSFQAAYTAPIIMMAQNRQSDIDRARAEQDYEVNLKAELEIELLHQKIDLMREQEIARLSAMVEELAQIIKAQQAGNTSKS